MTWLIVLAVLVVLVLLLLIANIRIVPQAYAFVVERFGVYHCTWEAGLHFKTPFIERISRRISLKEQVVDFKPQPVITRDNVTMDDGQVSAVPELTAHNVDAALIHEAAIGKIAGEQITKLMTLGLSEKQAEEKIIQGFLR